MTKDKMKLIANAFCKNSCSENKMYECDCHGKSCIQLANFLVDIKNVD